MTDRLKIESIEGLRSWLAEKLEPICDADPAALAKYVTALLKKDKPVDELREFCNEQLDVFLHAETGAFVKDVFEAVQSGSYLPQPVESSTSSTSTSSAHLNSSADGREGTSPRRRGLQVSSSTRRVEARRRSRSRSPQGRDRRRSPGSSRRRSRSRSPRRDKARPPSLLDSAALPPGTESAELNAALEERRKAKKPRCRDYDEKGYCMMGDRCPFDHGPDPVVVEDSDLPKVIAPGNPPPPGVEGFKAAAAPEPYNPEAPGISDAGDPGASSYLSYPPPPNVGVPPPPWGVRPPPMFPPPPMARGYPAPMGYPPPPFGAPPPGMGPAGARPRPPRGPHPGNWDNKTLEIRKVPPAQNNIMKLNEHFSTFGQITNIQVRYQGDPEAALITFATRPQAQNAYKSTAPILNNRFIKVFWHKPPENAAEGAEAASAVPLAPNPEKPMRLPHPGALKKVNNKVPETGGAVGGEEGKPAVPQAQAAAAVDVREAAIARRQAKQLRQREKQQKLALMELQKQKTELLSKQMAAQKSLLASMEKAKGDPAKTKELMGLFKTIEASVKKLAGEVKGLGLRLKAAPNRSKEELEKAALDLELEMISKKQDGQDVSDLAANLASLKEELLAAESAASTSPGSLGRRRRSSEQGGPGAPKRLRSLAMSEKKLDRRAKKVLVSGFSEDQKDELKKHLEAFGALDSLVYQMGENGEPVALAAYKTRQEAETALELAEDFGGKEKGLSVKWPLTSTPAKKPEPKVEEVKEEPKTPTRHLSASELLNSLDNAYDESDKEEEDPL